MLSLRFRFILGVVVTQGEREDVGGGCVCVFVCNGKTHAATPDLRRG